MQAGHEDDSHSGRLARQRRVLFAQDARELLLQSPIDGLGELAARVSSFTRRCAVVNYMKGCTLCGSELYEGMRVDSIGPIRNGEHKD